MTDGVSVIILAAGKGTRMKSDNAKVLHAIDAKPMVLYVLETARAVAGNDIVVVIGHQAERVRRVVSQSADVRFAVQEKQLGTGHAVLCALPLLPPASKDVVILCGDVPLIRPETVMGLVAAHREAGDDVTVLAVDLPDPTGYGRIEFDDGGRLSGIVEEADATPSQKKNTRINSGIYCASRPFLAEVLPQLRADNTQQELYLTDIILLGYRARKKLGVMIAEDPREILGINTAEELAAVEALMQSRDRIIP